jgi:hypothetical protein
MKCDNAVDLIIDSLMSTLEEEQQKLLSEHLQSCASCAAEARKMNELWKGMGELSAPPAAPHAAIEFGRRLVSRPSRRRVAPLLQAAAAVALFLLGSTAGFLVRGDGAPSGVPSAGPTTFLFLVRGEDPPGVPGTAVVQEYRDWALSLASEGRLAGANKLTDEPGRWISGSPAGEARTRSDVSGYFLVNASDYDEAIEIARTSPHVGYGGTFEIRQIDPTN